MAEPIDVPIRDESIRLGQFLKLANLVESGAEAKPLIRAARCGSTARSRPVAAASCVLGDVVELAGSRPASSDESAGDNLPW